MARWTKLWEGKTDDARVPPRVKLRIFAAHSGRCCNCNRRVGGKLVACYDHVVAIINGGVNAESNLQLMCSECHLQKTSVDVAEKAFIARKKLSYLGLKKSKKKIPGSRGSGYRKKLSGEVIKVDETN